ncbi:BrnA antitoxin family protein [Agrobacterium rhizogenes]|nr:BrnA antitoxin family protein [Rhizobium rhizogenes]
MSRLYDRIVTAEPNPMSAKKTDETKIRQLAFMPDAEFNKQIEISKGRGRPPSGKETVTLRVETNVVAYFKTFGDDWKSAMIDALRKAAHL